MRPPLFCMNKNAGGGKRRRQTANPRPNFSPTENAKKIFYATHRHFRSEVGNREIRKKIHATPNGNPPQRDSRRNRRKAKISALRTRNAAEPFTPDLNIEIRKTEIPTSCGKLSAFVYAPKNAANARCISTAALDARTGAVEILQRFRRGSELRRGIGRLPARARMPIPRTAPRVLRGVRIRPRKREKAGDFERKIRACGRQLRRKPSACGFR